MPRDTDRARLQDVREAIANIESSVRGQTYASFCGDREKVDSVILNFFKIGEAVTHLPDALLLQRPKRAMGEDSFAA